MAAPQTSACIPLNTAIQSTKRNCYRRHFNVEKEHVILSLRPVSARKAGIMRHRLPKSIHSQVEAVFHSIRAIRSPKEKNLLGIRSYGTWKVYRYEVHRLAQFMKKKGHNNIIDSHAFYSSVTEYLKQKLTDYINENRSRQTMEATLSALGKFSYALNAYIEFHELDIPPVEIETLRQEYYSKSKAMLPESSKVFDSRAYPDPISLIEAIKNEGHQLQASLQYEGGFRARGVGAPSNRALLNPLERSGLRGIGIDPVTMNPVGVVSAVEKGGKDTQHYVSIETYRRLEAYIAIHGKLESDYCEYIDSINLAAITTGQHSPGRGSHGLKHNFAEERYLECVDNGMTHEQALQQTSLEMSHFRFRETLTYTRGR